MHLRPKNANCAPEPEPRAQHAPYRCTMCKKPVPGGAFCACTPCIMCILQVHNVHLPFRAASAARLTNPRIYPQRRKNEPFQNTGSMSRSPIRPHVRAWRPGLGPHQSKKGSCHTIRYHQISDHMIRHPARDCLPAPNWIISNFGIAGLGFHGFRAPVTQTWAKKKARKMIPSIRTPVSLFEDFFHNWTNNSVLECSAKRNVSEVRQKPKLGVKYISNHAFMTIQNNHPSHLSWLIRQQIILTRQHN